jgi:hypothetical protein
VLVRQTSSRHKLALKAKRKRGDYTMYQFNDYLAIGIAQGFEEPDSEDEIAQAWQYLVDKGLVWELEGWFGRTAQKLIEQGIIIER